MLIDLIVPSYHNFPVSERTQRSIEVECAMAENVRANICTEGDNLPQCRNIAIRRSDADAFLPLDADDWLREGTAGMFGDLLAKYPECDVVYADWAEVTISNGKVDGYACLGLPWNKHEMSNHVCAPYSLMFTRRIWEKVGGYDETMLIAEDWEFQARMFLAGAKTIYVHIPTLYHLNREDSKIRQDMAKWGHHGLRAEMRQRVPELFT